MCLRKHLQLRPRQWECTYMPDTSQCGYTVYLEPLVGWKQTEHMVEHGRTHGQTQQQAWPAGNNSLIIWFYRILWDYELFTIFANEISKTWIYRSSLKNVSKKTFHVEMTLLQIEIITICNSIWFPKPMSNFNSALH